jgi:radical SAM superfamily enzyme YgiQ (UPF0313 family)
MFVYGADSDTLESLYNTADFAVEHGLNTAQFLVLTPLPGTPQTAQLEAEGRIFTKNWSLYDGHHVVHWPKNMTPYELQMAVMHAHKRFFTARRLLTIKPRAPMYRKHQVEGYLMSHAWEHVRENRDYLRELREFSESQHPPVSPEGGFLKSSLETVVR